jgi:hypothetical protein
MNSRIESLEPRRLFSALSVDQIAIQTDERALLTALSTNAGQNAQVRNAIHADLNVLHLFRPNIAAFAALARQESVDLSHISNDVHRLIIQAVKDQHQFLAAAINFGLHQNQAATRNSFNATLARYQQDRINYELKLTSDTSIASTGPAVAELNALGALAPTNVTLQSDVLSGTTDLTTAPTTLAKNLAQLETDAATLITDSSTFEIYGSENLLGAGFTIGQNPFAGATLRGLTTGATSTASTKFAGPSVITPAVGDFAGTDQVYVGSTQTAAAGQVVGPQVLTLDYSPLTQLGHAIKTFTLGLATNGFENPTINSPYTATINGVVSPALSSLLNSIDGAGRVEQFVSIGIDPTTLSPTKTLTITIDGPGGSGWAIDFATIGINNG